MTGLLVLSACSETDEEPAEAEAKLTESSPSVRVLVLGSPNFVASEGGLERAKRLAEEQLDKMNDTLRAQHVDGAVVLAGFEEASLSESGPNPTSETCQVMLDYLHDPDYFVQTFGEEVLESVKAEMEDLAARRRRYTADLVVGIINGPNVDIEVNAGAACVRGASQTAHPSRLDNSYAFVDAKAFASHVFIHEVGHLFGLEHRDDDFVAIPELAAGTLIMPKGRTMTYQGRTLRLTRIPVWSDREYTYQGYSVAPERGDADVDVLRRNFGAVASYYERWSAGDPVSVNP